jgi:hypothetical protein
MDVYIWQEGDAEQRLQQCTYVSLGFAISARSREISARHSEVGGMRAEVKRKVGGRSSAVDESPLGEAAPLAVSAERSGCSACLGLAGSRPAPGKAESAPLMIAVAC